jgi:2,3-bisphosphoglycerate-independent phosphoglycerate mutase
VLFEAFKWREMIAGWKRSGGRLHLLGLLQDEGVHAHQEHLFKIMRRARAEHPAGEIVIHPFLDGRDTPPRSTLEYLARLNVEMEAIGGCRIGTLMGRYYAMDRSRKYALTDEAFACLVDARGRGAATPAAAVEKSYAEDLTPDGQPMTDEYIPCHAIGDYDGIHDGDSVMHPNYRQDRAIQLTQAFVMDNYEGRRARRPQVTFLGFTRYWNEFEEYLLGAMDAGGGMHNLLGEVIAKAGLKQLRIAETQKFRHVTSFFNGKSTSPYPGEDQVDVRSRFDPATFASHPEMDAENVTRELLLRLRDNPYAFVAVNYANGDMVGHTGDLEAARLAIETVDRCVGQLVERLLELDAHILITADHGNSEQMVDYDTGMVKTSHTLNEVECIYLARDGVGVPMRPAGKLADIAPTVLALLGLPIPPEMTADNLTLGRPPWEK